MRYLFDYAHGHAHVIPGRCNVVGRIVRDGVKAAARGARSTTIALVGVVCIAGAQVAAGIASPWATEHTGCTGATGDALGVGAQDQASCQFCGAAPRTQLVAADITAGEGSAHPTRQARAAAYVQVVRAQHGYQNFNAFPAPWNDATQLATLTGEVIAAYPSAAWHNTILGLETRFQKLNANLGVPAYSAEAARLRESLLSALAKYAGQAAGDVSTRLHRSLEDGVDVCRSLHHQLSEGPPVREAAADALVEAERQRTVIQQVYPAPRSLVDQYLHTYTALASLRGRVHRQYVAAELAQAPTAEAFVRTYRGREVCLPWPPTFGLHRVPSTAWARYATCIEDIANSTAPERNTLDTLRAFFGELETSPAPLALVRRTASVE